jgi:hypothetical protein
MASRFLYLVRHGTAVSYNDAGHLPPELCGGPDSRPGCGPRAANQIPPGARSA